MLAIHRGRCPADGELTRLDGLQYKRKGFILAHIAIHNAHPAGLDRPLHNLEPREFRRRHLIYLPGIFYIEFDLQIIPPPDVLRIDNGSKFHLAGHIKARK